MYSSQVVAQVLQPELRSACWIYMNANVWSSCHKWDSENAPQYVVCCLYSWNHTSPCPPDRVAQGLPQEGLKRISGYFFLFFRPTDPMILFRGGIFNIPCEFVREFWSSPELLSGFRDKGTTWRLPCSVKAFGVIYFKAAAFTTWLALMSGASLSLLLVSLLATAFLPFRDDWFVFGVQ